MVALEAAPAVVKAALIFVITPCNGSAVVNGPVGSRVSLMALSCMLVSEAPLVVVRCNANYGLKAGRLSVVDGVGSAA